jgi:hypothetical protein
MTRGVFCERCGTTHRPVDAFWTQCGTIQVREKDEATRPKEHLGRSGVLIDESAYRLPHSKRSQHDRIDVVDTLSGRRWLAPSCSRLHSVDKAQSTGPATSS